MINLWTKQWIACSELAMGSNFPYTWDPSPWSFAPATKSDERKLNDTAEAMGLVVSTEEWNPCGNPFLEYSLRWTQRTDDLLAYNTYELARARKATTEPEPIRFMFRHHASQVFGSVSRCERSVVFGSGRSTRRRQDGAIAARAVCNGSRQGPGIAATTRMGWKALL